MDYTTLGRTGLRVSVMGLGAGGHSRLGQATGSMEHLEADVASILRPALPNLIMERLIRMFRGVDSISGQ